MLRRQRLGRGGMGGGAGIDLGARLLVGGEHKLGTGPQDEATVDLIHRLRDDVIPGAVGDGPADGTVRASGGSREMVFLVVGTGVDPVTFRFSGGRSAN